MFTTEPPVGSLMHLSFMLYIPNAFWWNKSTAQWKIFILALIQWYSVLEFVCSLPHFAPVLCLLIDQSTLQVPSLLLSIRLKVDTAKDLLGACKVHGIIQQAFKLLPACVWTWRSSCNWPASVCIIHDTKSTLWKNVFIIIIIKLAFVRWTEDLKC